MLNFKCVSIVFCACCIGYLNGIRTADNTEFTGRQSKAISFFPINDDNNQNHIIPQYNSLNQNYRAENQRLEDTFRFTNAQRNENLNQNEIIQHQPKIYNQNSIRVGSAQNFLPYQQQQPSPYSDNLANYQYFNRPYQYGLQSQQVQQQHQQPQQSQQPQHYRPQTPFRPQAPYRPYRPLTSGPQNFYYPGINPNQQNPYQTPNPQNYAGQFSNYQPFGGQFSNFLNNFQPNAGTGGQFSNFLNNFQPNGVTGTGAGGQFSNFLNNFQPNGAAGGGGNVGGQFTKALEDISRFDDYQCVPKLLCQMIGNPRGQNNLPSFLNAPTLTALIAAVPSTSPLLVFGRAALLGISGGERGCEGSYPKCPREEDDLLYYLNNHRGGFFRFFNGGSTFGDDDSQQYDPAQDDINQNYQSQPQTGGLTSLSGLQNLANAINQGGGVNLSNLGSNLGFLGNLASFMGNNGGGVTQSQNPSVGSSGGISDIVGNLLTGLVGNRFSNRRISKRSVTKEQKKLFSISGGVNPKKKGASKKRNLSVELVNPYETQPTPRHMASEKNPIDYNLLRLIYLNENRVESRNVPPAESEGRILNSNHHQTSIGSNQVNFPIESSDTSHRYPKEFNIKRPNTILVFNLAPDTQLKFPNIADSTRTGKIVRFNQEPEEEEFPKPLNYYNTNKMIFPDRTGTGNLRFDNNVFNADQDIRLGKILSGNQRPQVETSSQANFNYPQYPVVDNRYKPQNNRYTNQQTSRPQYSYTPNYQSQQEDTSQNIYVTNSKGVIEYYINKRGEKIYT